MKSFVIDSRRFSSFSGFLKYADEVLCVGFKSGRNMNAFHDILMGGFGAFDYEEEIEIVWSGAAKSKRDLGDSYGWVVDAIRSKGHIAFREEEPIQLPETTRGE